MPARASPAGARGQSRDSGRGAQDPGFQGKGQSPAQLINRADRTGLGVQGKGWEPGHWHWGQRISSVLRGSPHLAPMAFLVAGTLQVASQMADARESLGRKVAGGTAWPSPFLALS